MSISRNQLRAARILLCMSQEDLAREAVVGVTTIRLFEAGNAVGDAQLEALRATVESAGVILLGVDHRIDGRAISDGVALLARVDLPAETLARLDERASQGGRIMTGKVGRPRKQSS